MLRHWSLNYNKKKYKYHPPNKTIRLSSHWASWKAFQSLPWTVERARAAIMFCHDSIKNTTFHDTRRNLLPKNKKTTNTSIRASSKEFFQIIQVDVVVRCLRTIKKPDWPVNTSSAPRFSLSREPCAMTKRTMVFAVLRKIEKWKQVGKAWAAFFFFSVSEKAKDLLMPQFNIDREFV